MIIVIDDERTFDFVDTTFHIRTSQEAMSQLSHTAIMFETWPAGGMDTISCVFFDHDLGPKSDMDGVVVAHHVGILYRGCPDLFVGCQFFIHSQNPVGAQNIKNALERYGIDAQIIPLPPLKKD